MTDYVLGFAFRAPALDEVLLIWKNRPDWQKGRLNGIGGKIKQGELPAQAMAREFEEETGLMSNPRDWQSKLVLGGAGWRMYVFMTTLHYAGARTTTDEQLATCRVLPNGCLDPQHKHIIPNLAWLIPMCLEAGKGISPMPPVSYDVVEEYTR